MSYTFCFLTPWLPGQSSPQLLDLQLRLYMPPTKGLNWQGDEGQACSPTGVTRGCHLPGEGIVQGMARGGSCLADQSCLQRVDYGHIQCCVPTPGPVDDKDICRPGLWPRDKCSVLPGGTKSCTDCCVEECVPQVVVPGNTLSLRPTADGVIPLLIAGYVWKDGKLYLKINDKEKYESTALRINKGICRRCGMTNSWIPTGWTSTSTTCSWCGLGLWTMSRVDDLKVKFVNSWKLIPKK